MAKILDGKSLSAKIKADLAVKVSKLETKPHLAVILVGNDSASELYVGLKEKAATKIGIKSSIFKYPENTTEKTILDKINELNNDKDVHAILVQLPLPKQINEQNIICNISPQKDVDGFTPENIGKISIGEKPFAYPCTPYGIIKLLDEYNINIDGKHAVIVGRSNIVGKPLAQMLLNRNATVTICHSHTKNLSDITTTADILISAVGKNKIIRREMIKLDSVLIDVGTSKVNDKTCGDMDFDNLLDKASFITPVPGGVGPMTIASLMENTFYLAQNLCS